MAAQQNLVNYNGYEFNEYSEITLNATAVQDDAGLIVLYHRWRLRVETTIYADDVDAPGQAATHFARIRALLAVQCAPLIIHHQGFGPFSVNLTDTSYRDVAGGPHPRVLSWDPVGHDNAVHVVWECEFNVSSCGRWTGLMQYTMAYSSRVDIAGYNTRTFSGTIEIASTRSSTGQIVDNVNEYKDFVALNANFFDYHRETSWNASPDQRRATYSITLTPIRSPNQFPPDVINIQGSHNLNWSRRQSATLPQTIRATIELAQGKPRSRAWEIFRAIVGKRTAFAVDKTLIFENLTCDESLFGNVFSFSISYRVVVKPNEEILHAVSALTEAFTATGIASQLNLNTWQQWRESIANLQTHQGARGDSFTAATPINLCENVVIPNQSTQLTPPQPLPYPSPKLYNEKPPAEKSYLRYDTWMELDEETPTTVQISVDEEDLRYKAFDPTDPQATVDNPVTETQVKRFVETQAGRIEVVWRGYAERMGYPIPRPDKLTIGDIELKRVGRAQFRQKFLGNVLGQPVYAAAWNQRYVVIKRPAVIQTDDLDDWEL